MSEKPFDQSRAASRNFSPEVKPLESRLLLSRSQKLTFPDGTTIFAPLESHLPRTGGISVQSGSVLGIGVGQSTANMVQATDNGSANLQAQWNGGPVRSFTGVSSIVVETGRARRNQITFNLTGRRTGPTAVAVGSQVRTDAVSAIEAGHPPNVRRTSGTAVQSGSILTVTVNKPVTNTVEISNNGGGAVEVEWNGGAVHSFSGVETVVVDTRNARNNLVALDDATS